MKSQVHNFLISVGLFLMTGCANTSGPLATLPMTSPIAAVHNLEGIKRFNDGRWEEARILFERAVQADNRLAEAHFNLALALHKLGRHEAARKEFKIAGDLAPESKQIVDTSVYRNHLGLSSTFERHISGGYRY